MKEITQRQKEVLDYISVFSEQNNGPPVIREIAAAFGISVGTVQVHLEALRKKNYISWSDKRSRSIRIVSPQAGNPEPDDSSFTQCVPLVGTVAAGKPLLCEENREGDVPVARSLLKKNKTYFALRVRGDSMINAGILDGDIALIEQAVVANNGQIVVAVLDDAITLKRFYQDGARIRLQSENPAFGPIYHQNVRVAGILSHIIREY
ncbi:MAG: transcriptional repressor LexA [Treponema sp.]|jgi:repressor LexA|nr:transcriptional repressor LexA [Treponema sp.]